MGVDQAKDINKPELILAQLSMFQSSLFYHTAFNVFDRGHYNKGIAINLMDL